MRYVRAAVDTVVGLFVSDWVQSAVVVAIIAIGWFAVARFGNVALVAFVFLIAAQLVWFARADALRRSPRRSRS
ncbi:MAG TPA: hypothetical protein VFR33_14160 [Candidatus Dormibacteraeota bacterium]|nr:hypothetical protein [Candidatus Dormibacteraeota bacterium]